MIQRRWTRRGFIALVFAGVAGIIFERVTIRDGQGHDAVSSLLPMNGTYELPQRSIQSMVDSAGSGAVVTIPAGIYREQVTIDKPLTLKAEPGAEIRGSDVWTGWSRQGGGWIRGGLPEFGTNDVPCLPGSDGRCNWPEQVFWDGTPLRQVQQQPGHGQFAVTANREVVLADDPTGHLVEVTTRERWIVGAASDVTVTGFRMCHAASPPQRGAIDSSGFDRWTISDNVLSDAAGAVVFLEQSSGHQLLRNVIYNGGQEGVSFANVNDSQVQGNHIHDNNTEEFDTAWEACGMKATQCTNLTVRGNAFDHNLGAGLWFDMDSADCSVIGNWSHHNDTGIAYEISRGGTFQDNACWENGWRHPGAPTASGIAISSSKTTQVLDNVLGWNTQGITIMSQDRGEDHESTGIVVANNFIASSDDFAPGDRFGLCWFQDYDGVLYNDGSGNYGAENRYWYPTPEEGMVRFRWAIEYSHLAEFNQTPGEHDGSYISADEKDVLLTQAEVPLSQEQHSSL